ncbi:MAG: hypothetical protein WCI73_04950, partial [Phycisphaerae bacterium]
MKGYLKISATTTSISMCMLAVFVMRFNHLYDESRVVVTAVVTPPPVAAPNAAATGARLVHNWCTKDPVFAASPKNVTDDHAFVGVDFTITYAPTSSQQLTQGMKSKSARPESLSLRLSCRPWF